MYQFNYNGSDQSYKIWFDTMDNAEVTLIDGIRIHPWLDETALSTPYLSQFMTLTDNHEFGDSWYAQNYT